jgi:hypothetical protein
VLHEGADKAVPLSHVFGRRVLAFHQKTVLVPLASFEGMKDSSTKGLM